MSQLEELHRAIIKLNELWQVCDDDAQCEQLLEKKNELDRQAQILANETLLDGNEDLRSAMTSLKELSELAESAKEEINDIALKIQKTAQAIDKATDAIGKLALLSMSV
ncbi:hypothetical protein [Pleionea litopenaei]|uniref:Uncharacterized protein n=1 Tax=Pleionea litopenaei TaxID=3070815 RepID=A0AA51RUR5_9GAMM|nr:hypothetical protein [Pleionea sp. HL-JVS1]WMS87945.1 hypothetical protein Q9312_03250 [Pleionea sp. HL-JVS1]